MMTIGIMICHGRLAFELLDTAGKILGKTDHVFPFSNERLSPELLYREIHKVLQLQKSHEIIMMVDMRGGNCWKIARLLSKEFPRIRVFSGVNLPMVLSFLTKREKFEFPELMKVMETDAHRGIVLE